MPNYPTTIQQYIDLGRLLASALNINVRYLDGNDMDPFGPGWSHGGSDDFGILNGDFGAKNDAHADLAARCIDACYSDDPRYDAFITQSGRDIIISSIFALSSIDSIISGSKQPAR